MDLKPLTNPHPWSLNPQEAVALQKHLAGKVIRCSEIDIEDIATVAGVDTHFHQSLAIAAVVIIRLSNLATEDYSNAVKKISFPYIPGLLTFRESPAILAALDHLTAVLNLLIFDGQGLAHPRRCGLASHMGLLLDMPSIGSAKTRLWGRYKGPHTEKGSYSYLNCSKMLFPVSTAGDLPAERISWCGADALVERLQINPAHPTPGMPS